MKHTEVIQTPRLRLEPFSEGHISQEGVVAWLNDPEVTRFSDQRHRKHTKATSQAYLESFVGSGNGYWAVMLQSEAKHMIGTITAYVDSFNAVADVGILIGDKRFWRGGYGVEAFSGVVEWLFTSQKMRKVTAGTMAANEGMLGIMRKIGMKEEGRRIRYYLFENQEIDMVLGSIFDFEWCAGKTKTR